MSRTETLPKINVPRFRANELARDARLVVIGRRGLV
jgi:hypothetical protein